MPCSSQVGMRGVIVIRGVGKEFICGGGTVWDDREGTCDPKSRVGVWNVIGFDGERVSDDGVKLEGKYNGESGGEGTLLWRALGDGTSTNKSVSVRSSGF